MSDLLFVAIWMNCLTHGSFLLGKGKPLNAGGPDIEISAAMHVVILKYGFHAS